MARRGGKRRRRKQDAESRQNSSDIKDDNDNGATITSSSSPSPSLPSPAAKKTKHNKNDGDDDRDKDTTIGSISISLIGTKDDGTSVKVPPCMNFEDDDTNDNGASDNNNNNNNKNDPEQVLRSTWKGLAETSWKPTRIQRHVWPLLLQTSYNTIAISPTGSGKTLLYALPAVIQALFLPTTTNNNTASASTTILVLVPTRELVHQVASTFQNALEAVVNACTKQQNEKQQQPSSSKPSAALTKSRIVPIHGGVRREEQRQAIERAKVSHHKLLQKTIGQSLPIILVATPGRLLDLLQEQSGDKTYSSIPTPIQWIVLDEADHLTKEGDLGPQVDEILGMVTNKTANHETPSTSRLVLVSATYPRKCHEKFREWVGPCHVHVTVDQICQPQPLPPPSPPSSSSMAITSAKADDSNTSCPGTAHATQTTSATLSTSPPSADRHATSLTRIPSHLEQIIHVCSEHKKPRKLVHILQSIYKQHNNNNSNLQSREKHQSPRGIIFYSKIEKLRQSEKLLQKEGIRCIPLHGQLSVDQRQRNLKSFVGDKRHPASSSSSSSNNSNKPLVLLATDVAARGVDIPRIAFVIQYDFPSNLEQYAHRCGRAGRSVVDDTNSQDARMGPDNDNVKQKTKPSSTYVVYSFFTRNLHPLAANLVQLLEASQAWVDPNLRDLIAGTSGTGNGGGAAAAAAPASVGNGRNVKTKKTKTKVRVERRNDNPSNDGNMDDDEEYADLSANRIVLKRASHVSDASEDEEDDNDADVSK